MMGILCGVSGNVISAPLGTELGGYWGRETGSTGVNDELQVRVLYTRTAACKDKSQIPTTLIVVSLDLIGVSSRTSEIIKNKIHSIDVCGAAEVLVCCSHTHTGPQTHDGFIGMGHAGTAYMEELGDIIVATTKTAIESATACELSHQRSGSVGISINRRERDTTNKPDASVKWFEIGGNTKLGQNPDGPCIDNAHIVSIWTTNSLGERVRAATLFQFACHPTCVGPLSLQSADYVGAARRVVETKTAAPAIFLQGACGDVNPIQHKSGYEGAKNVGESLGNAIVAALEHATESSTYPHESIPTEIRCFVKKVQLPLEALPSREEALDFLKQQTEWLAEVKASGGNDRQQRTPACCFAHAKETIELIDAGQEENTIDFDMSFVRLGPIAIVTFPGEIFSEYELNIEAFSPFQSTLVVGYCNGCIGYVPTAAEFSEGGYEVLHSFRVYGQHQRLEKECENVILDAVKSGLDRLNGIEAELFDSGFPHSHDTYNATTCMANGDVYYVLSSEQVPHGDGGKMYRFNASTKQIEFVDELSRACNDDTKSIAQGKSHVPFFESVSTGEIFFATHIGYYQMIDGMENVPRNPPPGHTRYAGGCFLAYQPRTKTFTNLTRMEDGEGVLTFAYSQTTGDCYALTWPSGYFVHYDSKTKTTSKLDYPGRGKGEGVHPTTGDYRCVCRSMVVDDNDASVYWSNAFGSILRYSDGVISEALVAKDGLKRDYFGKFDPTQPGSMAYHWRQVFWHPTYRGGCVLGVHGNSGYLFAFVPVSNKTTRGRAHVELICRITSDPSQTLGLSDLFSYGYLGFALGDFNGEDTVFYLTGGPIIRHDGSVVKGKDFTPKGEARGLEHLHLVTYQINKNIKTDHGCIFYRGTDVFPTYVNSLTVGSDGYLYSLGRKNFHDETTDLFRIPIPQYSTAPNKKRCLE
eukprot:m.192009 g.192009  ORF g.192009 m.192009 type:complete len:923 (+) comp32451_c0_seq1:215-2983(+)